MIYSLLILNHPYHDHDSHVRANPPLQLVRTSANGFVRDCKLKRCRQSQLLYCLSIDIYRCWMWINEHSSMYENALLKKCKHIPYGFWLLFWWSPTIRKSKQTLALSHRCPLWTRWHLHTHTHTYFFYLGMVSHKAVDQFVYIFSVTGFCSLLPSFVCISIYCVSTLQSLVPASFLSSQQLWFYGEAAGRHISYALGCLPRAIDNAVSVCVGENLKAIVYPFLSPPSFLYLENCMRFCLFSTLPLLIQLGDFDWIPCHFLLSKSFSSLHPPIHQISLRTNAHC